MRPAGRDSPRRATHFLLRRQEKSKQREGDPKSGSLRCATGNLRCSTPAGVRRTRFAQTTAALIPPPSVLLGPATRVGNGYQYRIHKENTRTNKDTPRRVLVVLGSRVLVFGCLVFLVPPPSVCAEERRARRIRDRDCLSRRRVERDPAWTEHHRLPAAQRRDADSRVAFSLVTFFWRSKRKLLAAGLPPAWW